MEVVVLFGDPCLARLLPLGIDLAHSLGQAGTAVLVDNHGIPRVKCGCGNPLTEPTNQPITTTTGTRCASAHISS